MIIDYGATPPIKTLSLGDGSHLTNYRRVYASSEKAAARGEVDLDAWFAECDRAGIGLTVIKARDVETTFGGRVTNEAVAEAVAAHGRRSAITERIIIVFADAVAFVASPPATSSIVTHVT